MSERRCPLEGKVVFRGEEPGDAAGLLVAASRDAELIGVGRHRRRLPAPARMMGSVTQAVLLPAAAPVEVVPPTPGEE